MRTVSCIACGLVWADPRPHEARRFYEEEYRLAYKKTFTPRPKHIYRAGLVALDRFHRIRGRLDQRRSVLDVGSGGGEFAHLLSLHGHAVTGVEPNRGYAEYSRQAYALRVLRGFIDEVALTPAAFDMVTIWHVLEHTENPRAVLRQVREALRPRGQLVVEVPNVEATCQSPRSSFHEAHLYTFSRKTLQVLGENCGFLLQEMNLSRDGGNITAIFAKVEASMPERAPKCAIPGHHAEVVAVIAQHTPWSHALSAHPWRRAGARFVRAVSEQTAIRGADVSGQAILQRLYASSLSEEKRTKARSRRMWAWLAGAYALAVAAEEILLDQVLPTGNLGSAARTAIYFGLQVTAVGGLLWIFKRKPASLREVMAIGGWAAPLFAIPAVC